MWINGVQHVQYEEVVVTQVITVFQWLLSILKLGNRWCGKRSACWQQMVAACSQQFISTGSVAGRELLVGMLKRIAKFE